MRRWLSCVMVCAALAAAPALRAQEQEQGQGMVVHQEVSLDSVIALVRANMQADRASVVTSAMELNAKDSAAFWPVYRDYERERAKLDDLRVAVIKEYSQNYASLSDAEATKLAEKMFESESRLAAMKKKYYKRFNKVLPGYQVAKFFQVDRRFDLMMDMKVEWSLPPLTAAKSGVGQ